jgi:hypothetical protein
LWQKEEDFLTTDFTDWHRFFFGVGLLARGGFGRVRVYRGPHSGLSVVRRNWRPQKVSHLPFHTIRICW